MRTVLALGGGGIKGLVTARFLAAVDELKPDLAVGTSTGGILALALAIGKRPDSLPSLYQLHGPRIFKRRLLGGVLRAKYGNEGLRQVLSTAFGGATMGDCQFPVMVVCQWKANNQLSLIKSWRDTRMSLVDAALCTSAAPTYFPSHYGRIDGGVARNNPSMVAMVEALTRFHGEPFRLLSIACPRAVSGSDPENGDWGVVPWLTHGLISSFMDAGMDASAYETQVAMAALGYPYLHIEPEPDAMGAIPMDDASPAALGRLRDAAFRLIESRGEETLRFLTGEGHCAEKR